jgi:ATP diphosphatase
LPVRPGLRRPAPADSPETALRRANVKFIERFTALEKRLQENGTPLGAATLDEMEAAWQDLKKSRG